MSQSMSESSSENRGGRLKNKVAIVTGSSSGIGRAIALLFAAEDADLVCADIRQEIPYENGSTDHDVDTHLLIQQNGSRAIFVHTDVSSNEDMQNLVATAVAEYGRIDIFVNNAGVFLETTVAGPIWTVSENTWDTTQRINSRGTFLGCKYATEQMIMQEAYPNGDRGWIVNVASVLGLVGQANASSYCASQGAIVNLTRAVALDCAPYRIHVNAICPGYTSTPMTEPLLQNEITKSHLYHMHPFRGLGIPDDVARAALFLASEDCSWVSGACLPVDGGYSAQ